jgi:pteridine reductase
MRIAAITGAGHRIGRAIAENMMSLGYQVILHAHSSFDELSQWTSLTKTQNQVLGLIAADLSSAAGQKSFCKQIANLTDHLDVLVNNAAIFGPKAFEEIKRTEFRKMQSINLEAPFFITQELVPMLKKSPKGCVINIVDALWDRPYKYYSHYAVSKAGLAILTKSLALELSPYVRVNAIAPGAIMFPDFYDEDKKRRILELIPLKRLGNTSEIGHAVAFLTEGTLTGQILTLDGGRSIIA